MIKCRKLTSTDTWNTPKQAWETIAHLIPPEYKVIYESAYSDGRSGEILREIFPDRKIIHEEVDYFENEFEYDIEITNPPYSLSRKWLTKVKESGKPFVLILPSFKLHTNYFRDLFESVDYQLIIPRSRIQFTKEGYDDKKCPFDCFYYTSGLGLDKQITFL